MTIWTKLGAWQGGAVLALATNADVVLAATLAGVFRSEDGGSNWRFASDNFGEQSITCVAISPDGKLTLAANGAGGLFQSRDAGATWSPVKSWSAEYGRVNAIAFSPAFAQDGALFVGTTQGPYRSLDRARTWQFAEFGLMDLDVTCIAVSPDFAESETLWVGGAAGGVARSRNGARAWRECGMGLPDSPATALLATAQGLFAGFEEGGIHFSANLGETWQRLGLEERTISSLLAHGAQILAATDAGIYATSDGGNSWRRLNRSELGVLSIAVAGDTILAGTTDDGVQRVAASGAATPTDGIVARVPPAAFAQPGEGMLAQAAMGIMAHTDNFADWKTVQAPFGGELQAIGANERGELLAAADGALHLRGPAGRWKSWALDLPVGDIPLTIASNGDRWWLGTSLGAVFAAARSGAVWKRLDLPDGIGAMRQLLATADGGIHIVAETESRNGDLNLQIWRAEPGDKFAEADDWALLTTLHNPRTSWISLLTTSDKLLIGAHNSVIAVTRKQGGALQGKPVVLNEDGTVTALAQTQDGALWAATTLGVFRSTDGGGRWKDDSGPLAGRAVVALLAGTKQLRAVVLGGEVWAC